MRDVEFPITVALAADKWQATVRCTLWDSPSEIGRRPLRTNYSSLPRWAGDARKAVDGILHGDVAAVGPSDKLLSRLENASVMPTPKFRTLDSVCGGVPNIGAYLAGTPDNMRQRRRVVSEAGPLAVVVDISHGNMASADDIAVHGAALLALVRSLALRRPVDLYVYAGMGNTHVCDMVLIPIETRPLDLARAAHMLSYEGVWRIVCYDHISNHFRTHRGWELGSSAAIRANGAAICQRILGVDEVLYIPALSNNEQSYRAPVEWITEQLDALGGRVL